jgi:hypothetical protein
MNRLPGLRPLRGKDNDHGEFALEQLEILDLVEFVLVTLLGFMPLIVIHWADRRPQFRVLRSKLGFRQDIRRLAAVAKTFVLVWLVGSTRK